MKSSSNIYLDHNATTPLHERIISKLPEFLVNSGNPSSIHQDSREPKKWLRETRSLLAQHVGAQSPEMIFTSGASEASSTVFNSVWEKRPPGKNRIVISGVEHPSVTNAAASLKSKGADVQMISVSRAGKINLEQVRSLITPETLLVSVMRANNEIGSLFPVTQISEIAHAQGALMHSDLVQAFGKVRVNVRDLGLDYASFSAHKTYSLKGVGALYVKRGSPLTSLVHGGGQERGRRGGTENTLGIAAWGLILEIFEDLLREQERIKKLRDLFETLIQKEIEQVQINAQDSERLGNTSSLIIKGVDGEAMLMSLDLIGFSVSTGAACSSGNPEPSPVLLAIGLSREEAQNSLRVSFGLKNNEEDVFRFIDALKVVTVRIRQLAQEEEMRHGT